MHLRYGFEAPIGRTEQFYAQIDNKLKQVMQIAKEHSCKALISTGDILDKSSGYQLPQISAIGDKLLELNRVFSKGILSVLGNHDTLWASRDYKPQSFYGYLVRHGLIKDIVEAPFEADSYTITGVDFTNDTATLKKEIKELDAQHKNLIMVLHTHLVPTEAQRIPFGECYTYQEITQGLKNTAMIIAGHLHKGFPVETITNDTGSKITIINQWGFTRLARDYYSVSGKHTPQVVIIDTDSIHTPLTIDLQVEPFDKTFIQKDLDRETETQKSLAEFVCKASSVKVDNQNIDAGGIPESIRSRVLYYINKAENAKNTATYN